jgi:vacuolar-type H+-ATPase subunit F/Vma7
VVFDKAKNELKSIKMVKIAAAGSNEFIVGFQLAGVRDTIELPGDSFNKLKDLKSKKDYGIIIVDENIMNKLDLHQRLDIEASVDPVFIPVSAKAEQDSLRRLIKKSVGVDLWK